MGMNESVDWDALRMLRMGGRKPSLPVIVTTKAELPQRLEGVGAMVIRYEAGTSMPVQLLDGLDVIFMFDRCELAGHVQKLAKSKGVTFASARTWCKCGGLLSILPLSCEGMAQAIAWITREPSRVAT